MVDDPAGAVAVRERWTRATALGALFGGIASAVIVLGTADLRDSVGSALLFSGPVVCFYVGLFWLVVAALTLAGAVAERLGAAPGAFSSARFLWSLALAVALFTTVNDARRSFDWVYELTLPLRVVLGLAALYLIVDTVRSRRAAGPRVRALERAGAALAVPAVLLAGAYGVAGREPRAPGEAFDVVSLAPLFAPEPEQSLEPASTRPRVLLLGLDGASWDRVERGIDEGRLPTFERLVRGGVRAPLETLVPTYSPAIWTSMTTGVRPDVHGIDTFYMFQVPRLGVGRLDIPRGLDLVEEFLTATGELVRVPVTSSLRRSKAIWNLADEAGLTTAVLGLWATWPPEPLEHGLVLSDHASLARRYEWLNRRKTSRLTPGPTTYPPELAARFESLQRAPASVTREELGQFLTVDDAVWAEFQEARRFSKAVDLSAFRSSHLNDEFYLRSAVRIWEEDRPDLMVVYAKAIDELSHFFYEMGVPEAARLGHSPEEIARYGPVVDRAYTWTDREIAPLVELVDRDPSALLIVVSDHGWEREPDGGYDHNDGPPGILILYGADVCSSGCPDPGELSILDVAPTVLERLGLPLSLELPGRPIRAFRNPYATRTVARYGPPLGKGGAVPSEIDPELREKLRALGYMD